MTDVFGPIEHTYTFTEVGYCDVTAQFRSIQRIEQICKQSFGPKRVQKRGPKKGSKNTVTIYNIAIADSTILLSCFSDYISAYWVRPIISCNCLSIVFPLIDVSFFKYVLLYTIYVFVWLQVLLQRSGPHPVWSCAVILAAILFSRQLC